MNRGLQGVTAALLLFAAGPAVAQDRATKEAADKLHAAALQEPDSGKAAEMLCKAAGMVPKNTDFVNDCTSAKRAMIDADQRNLQRAIDAADNGKVESAKGYARHVTTLDPKLHEQAQALIAKLNAPTAPAQPTAPVAPAGPSPSVALLAQAQGAFDSGNLGAAKNAAQQVTDPSMKPSASHLLSEIESYSNAVSEGHRHEDAKEYAQAANSYQAALGLNSHVGSDDLNGRISHMRQLASAPAPTATPTAPVAAPVVVANNSKPNTPPQPKPQAPALSPQDKQRMAAGFVTEADMAFGRKDYNAAESKFRQALVLDPQNADAKRGMSDTTAAITAQLSHDPAMLENTLRDALKAFYASDFDSAQQNLNRYLGAQGGKKKGAAYFYLGATEQSEALLAPENKRAFHLTQAKDNFKQARAAGYQPVQKFVSSRILDAWQQAGS